MIDKENKQMELNRSRGVGKTKAFEDHPVNYDSKKPMRDERGRICKAITVE